jgi:hypothetical protein
MISEQQILQQLQQLPSEKWSQVLEFIQMLNHQSQPVVKIDTDYIDKIAGCLKYTGTPKTLEDFDLAIAKGIKEQWHVRD